MDKEYKLFHILLSNLQIVDNFLLSHILRYSWDNKKKNDLYIMAYLDLTYIFDIHGPSINNL